MPIFEVLSNTIGKFKENFALPVFWIKNNIKGILEERIKKNVRSIFKKISNLFNSLLGLIFLCQFSTKLDLQKGLYAVADRRSGRRFR